MDDIRRKEAIHWEPTPDAWRTHIRQCFDLCPAGRGFRKMVPEEDPKVLAKQLRLDSMFDDGSFVATKVAPGGEGYLWFDD